MLSQEYLKQLRILRTKLIAEKQAKQLDAIAIQTQIEAIDDLLTSGD